MAAVECMAATGPCNDPNKPILYPHPTQCFY